MALFGPKSAVFWPEIHFLCTSSNVFVTIMTGHQKDNIFVLIMLQGKLLGGYKGPVLAQNMALIDQNYPFWGQKCIIIFFAL